MLCALAQILEGLMTFLPKVNFSQIHSEKKSSRVLEFLAKNVEKNLQISSRCLHTLANSAWQKVEKDNNKHGMLLKALNCLKKQLWHIFRLPAMKKGQ